MKYILHYQIREGVGKERAKKYRKVGKIPAIIYGKGEESVPILVDEKEFIELLSKIKGKFPVVELKGEKGKSLRAVIKSIQKHPITDEFLHIDFHHIHVHETVYVDVPIHLKGEAPGVKKGGMLDQILYELPVKGSMNKIPPFIEVDISNLEIGDSVHVKDLSLKGIEPDIDPESTIVTILAPKKVEEEVEEVKPEEVPEEEEKQEEKEEEKKEE